MLVNKDSDTIVLHKDIYERIINRLASSRTNLYSLEVIGKHARKFNQHLAQSHKGRTHRRELLNKLTNKKLHILLRLRRQAHAKGEKFYVWRRSDNIFYGYSLAGVAHPSGNPSKRFLRLQATRYTRDGETIKTIVVHINDVYVEWTSDLDSYTSSMISAGMSLGLEPAVMIDRDYGDALGNKALVNHIYGFVGFQKDPAKECNSCPSI